MAPLPTPFPETARQFSLVFAGIFFCLPSGWRCSAGEVLLKQAGYEITISADGLAVSHQGSPLICASHLTIYRPEWKGTVYPGRNLPQSKTAKLEVGDNRILITDSIPEFEGQITHEIRVDGASLLVSLKLQIGKDAPPCPVEYVPAVLLADTFAGGRFRASKLLGFEDWQTLPLEKPKATGPGTQLILANTRGLDIEGKVTLVRIESLAGPSPSFYDMRSREYPPSDRNYWLLYSWQAGKGEMTMETRISAKPAESVAAEGVSGKVFVLDGKKRLPVQLIVVDKAAHEVEKAAAKELQTYIRKMCGEEVPILEPADQRPPKRGVVYVGKIPSTGGLFRPKFYRDRDFQKLGYDGFIVRSKGGNVLAMGKNHLGTTYAVYHLLEKLGCGFYAQEFEKVPSSATVEIPGPYQFSDSAGFEWRAMLGTIPPLKCSLSPGEWEAKVGEVHVPKMMGIPKGGFWHHTMGFLLPAKDLAESHPEYLALIRGQRGVVGSAVQQYCLSNPELLRRMTDAVLAWIASEPDRLYYPVHYGDVVSFCECEQCKALYAEKGSITDAVIWFDNQIAKEVAQKFPGKFITILAYHSTRRAPVKVKPEANLLIIFCAIVECQARPWTAPINMKKDVCKDLEQWIALHPLGAKGIISFDYPTTYHYAGFPYPALYAYVENIRYYHKLGLRGVYVCGLGGWKHLEHLYSYVMPRIMWKPEQDMAALVDEFCQAWFGAAWKPMRDYVDLLHGSAMESQSEGVMDCHAGPGQKFFRELYTREFLDEAHALFKNAESLAEDDFVKRRIMKEKWGLLFVDLFLHGQRSGDLVPVATELGIERKTADLDSFRKMSEFLRINQLFNRPWNMEPRRQFTLSSLIGIEPSVEPWWACPRIKEVMDDPAAAHAKQSDIVGELGGHLVTLESQHLKAVLIPRLGGRIWRLYHKATKQDILWRGRVAVSALERGLSSANYANLGGYEEYAGEKFGSPGWAEAFQCQASPDGKSATLTASLPGGPKLTRIVSFVADGTGIEIDSTLENTSAQPIKDAILRGHPQFHFVGGDKSGELSARARDGAFRTLPVKGEFSLSGPQLPAGAWVMTLPKSGIRIVHEFDPAQVASCLFYAGPEFFNLELFSAKKAVAPGERIRLKHRYVIESNGGR